MSQRRLVTVTGASGFVAMHCIAQLLAEGHCVRGTLRTPTREAGIREALERELGRSVGAEFTVVRADLSEDAGWNEAMQDADGLLHVASPLPREPPKHEDELILPARDGALRALRAAHEAGVPRIVMTSSIAAVAYGHADGKELFDESDWSRPVAGVGAYEKSKTIAERAAWDFIESIDATARPHFATICPGLVLGPVLDADYGTSGELIRKLMRRDIPGCPNLEFGLVDVRDVARAHLLALERDEANQQRFIVANAFDSMPQIARILRREFGPRGYRVPTWVVPDFVIRFASIFDKTVRLVLNELGQVRRFDNSRAERVLGWSGRGTEEMTIAMAESLIRYGVV